MIGRILLVAILLSAALGWAGCRAPASPPPAAPQPAPPNNNQPPSALPGAFSGTLPCADCSGIRTELTMIGDPPAPAGGGSYTLKETYLGARDGDRTFETAGRWLVLRGSADDPNATVYQLNPQPSGDPRYFLRVGEDALRLLDRQQRGIASAANLTLARAGRSVLGGYTTIDVTTPDVQSAAAFAVAARARSTGQAVTLRAITRAERQVVKGMNYRLCLDVTVDGTSQPVQALVYRDLTQQETLTQWDSGPCDTR